MENKMQKKEKERYWKEKEKQVYAERDDIETRMEFLEDDAE